LSVNISCRSSRGRKVQPPPGGGGETVDQLQLVPQALNVRCREFGTGWHLIPVARVDQRKRQRGGAAQDQDGGAEPERPNGSA